MTYRVQFSRPAERAYDDLPQSVRARIAPRINALATDPRPPGALKLTGSTDFYRIRVGHYRVIYSIQDDVLLVLIVSVGHRREVYR